MRIRFFDGTHKKRLKMTEGTARIPITILNKLRKSLFSA
jgi:hypothetical protein